LFCDCERFGIQKRLQGGLAEAVFSRTRSFAIIGVDPDIDIGLQLLKTGIELPPECRGLELVLDGLMEALANAIRLRALGLGARVVNVL